MGAEVIKIESQVYIDIGRINPSGMADRIAGFNRNGYYHALNYGKKAITLNLATDKGRALADDIIRKSDIVLECFPTPAATKLGITYERVRAVKPDIVMVSVSLLGKTGLEPSSWVGGGRWHAASSACSTRRAIRAVHRARREAPGQTMQSRAP